MYKCSLSSKQYFYFQKNGYILFEEILKESEQKNLMDGSLDGISERNIWKKQPPFKKLCSNRNLTSFCCMLANTSFLRLGFDHFFARSNDVANLFKEEKLLSEVCSLQNLSTSVFMNLSETPLLFTLVVKYYKDSEENVSEKQLIRNEIKIELGPRCALFFDPNRIRFIFDGSEENTALYLVTYTQKSSRYIFCEDDPYTHDIKREGSVFGDTLKDSLHPLFECKTSL